MVSRIGVFLEEFWGVVRRHEDFLGEWFGGVEEVYQGE